MRLILPIFILIFSLASEAKQKFSFYVSACLPYMEFVDDGSIQFVFNCEETKIIDIEIDEVSKMGKWEREFTLTGAQFKTKIEVYAFQEGNYSIQAKILSGKDDLATVYQAYHEDDYSTLIAHKTMGTKGGWPHFHFGDPKLANKEARHRNLMKKFLLEQVRSNKP